MGDTISVIIPIYKVEAFLNKCICSVVNQTYKNIEIILVDDGSPDNCPEMCNDWAKKDERVKVIHKANGGLSDARNAGLNFASGEFIAFVDGDDYILPDMYERMLNAMQSEHADICACAIRSCYPDYEAIWGCKEYFVGKPVEILGLLYSDTQYPVATWNKLYRRECWKNLRFPVGKLCEDVFTTYKLVHGAKQIVLVPEPYYCYRIRPGSIMTSAFSEKRMDEEEAWRVNYLFVEKNYPELYDKAFCFYLQKVNILIRGISREERPKYKEQFNYLLYILKENLLYILLKSGLDWKQRIRFMLDFVGLLG